MILPTKHIKPEDSLLASGTIVLEAIREPLTVSKLWVRVSSQSRLDNFDKFSLTLSLLYSLGAISFEQGLIRKVAE